MREHDGDLVLVRQIAVQTHIDAHIMTERAEGIEAVLFIDEIIVGTIVN